MLYEAYAKSLTLALRVAGTMRTSHKNPNLTLGSFMYGPETANKYLSCMVIRILSTHFLYCQLEKSYLQGRTDVSKSGITENVFRPLHFPRYQFGVSLFNRMEISFVEAVMGTYESSRVTRLDLHQMRTYVSSTKRWPIQPFHKSL